ncbi:hypothetical protein Q4595_22990, partial [Wenyingzhuangia sp. 1_MG-2023]|nr:hypothetical protein [Wenyingzhuangia sp. 1_MG-2023]
QNQSHHHALLTLNLAVPKELENGNNYTSLSPTMRCNLSFRSGQAEMTKGFQARMVADIDQL